MWRRVTWHVEKSHVEESAVEESHVDIYIYRYRYIETVTSLPDRQCPEQGRIFFVVQDFVLGYVYIYIYMYISIYLCTRTLSSECIYAYVYLCIYILGL